jgi:hypothetical protein
MQTFKAGMGEEFCGGEEDSDNLLQNPVSTQEI